ncbi:MAG: acyl dehydratase, partial [Chromatiales bacterium]|nr:acyl dehydratase [Chromatiales bacterium]
MSDANNRFPTITEKDLDALRRRIDVRIAHQPEPWCFEATRDNIRHYAHGIGDDNPLWCDPEYAREGRFGGLVGLPSFLFSCSRIISGYVGGLPGVHAMWAGADWTWLKPAQRNDEIHTESWLKDVIERDTRFSGRAVQQIYHVDFFNQDGDPIAQADSWCFRTERDAARETGTKYTELKAREQHQYSQEQLDEIYKHYANAERRGAMPRYFDEVSVGDTV